MNASPQIIQYQEIFSLWARSKINLKDDFDLFCESDFDFIEILMLFEKEFNLNLLDSGKVREDFKKIDEFISWAGSQPYIEQPFVFSFYYKPKVLPISELPGHGRATEFHV